MMNRKIHFITYGEGGMQYENAKKRIINEAKQFNEFISCRGYGYTDLTDDFKNKYRNILQFKKGAGYWIWKIDIIKQKLDEINDGEYIVYLDAGCTINKQGKLRFLEYLDLLDNSNYGVIDFEMMEPFNLLKKQCTKQVFDYFKIDVNNDIVNRGGCVPGALIIKKNRHIELILQEFLNLLDFDSYLVTDNYNKINQHSSFWDHRHDQSIFTCLFIKYGALNIKRNETWSFTEKQRDSAPENGNWGCKESLKYPFWSTRKR